MCALHPELAVMEKLLPILSKKKNNPGQDLRAFPPDSAPTHTYMGVCMYIYMSINICTYIYVCLSKERERELDFPDACAYINLPHS